MNFKVSFRDDTGAVRKQSHFNATFTISDAGVITIVNEDGKKTHLSPGFWCMVEETGSGE